MNSLEKSVQEIGREYVERRKEIEETWQFEFDTVQNRLLKQQQIDEVDRFYREKLREKKIEHILKEVLIMKFHL